MDQLIAHGRKQHRGRRGLLVLAVFGATLLACTGQAYAQTTPPDSGAVDQYVEDVPTAGGSTVPGKGRDKDDLIKPSVATQIDEQGGVDAPVLTAVASSADYGAGPKLGGSKAATPKPGARGEDISSAAPEADASSVAAAGSAVSAVQGAGTARLVGFLFVLFAISVATVAAAAARRRPVT